MADIIDTPLRLFAELKTDRTLAGHYQLEMQRRVEDAGKEIVPPSIKIVDLTPEEGAAILGAGAADKAAEVQSLNAQFDGFRATIAALEARLARAVAALNAVAAADASWDNTPRSQVAAAIDENK